MTQYWQLEDTAWLREQYVDRGRTAADIAREIGAPSMGTVTRHLRRAGIPTRSGSDYLLAGARARLDDAQWMREQYETLRRSSGAIGQEIGVSAKTICAALRRHQIPVRPSCVDRGVPA